MLKQALPIGAAILVARQAEAKFATQLAAIPVLPVWLSAALIGTAAGILVHKVAG